LGISIIGMTTCPKVSRRAGRDRYNDVAYQTITTLAMHREREMGIETFHYNCVGT